MVSRVSNRHELAQLIDEVKQGKQWSDEDLARHARRAGHAISKQHIANLRAQDPLKSLVPSTLRALAAGLEVPVPRVVQAAIAAAGLPSIGPPVDWSIEAAIDADTELPVAAKRLLKQAVAVARGTDSNGATPLTRRRSRAVGQPASTGRAARKRQ
jgi:hypothetical protein